MKKQKHLAGKQYQIDDEVISAVEDYFKDQDERLVSLLTFQPTLICTVVQNSGDLQDKI